MYVNRSFYTLVPVVVLAVVLLVLQQHGNASRVIASGISSFSINAPEGAYGIWKANNVRGRVLVLFDRYPHITGRTGYDGIPKLTSSNLIEFSIFENIIRKIYLVVPDREWAAFLQQDWIRPLRSVPGLERGFFLGSRTGVPLIATTPSSLPQFEEPPLVYINTQVFDDRAAREVLGRRQIVSDIVISVRSGGT